MRVFLDTNALISAFITRGLCADIFRIILSEHDLILSTHVLSELEVVLKQKIILPQNQITSILKFLRTFEIVANHTLPKKIELRDENDIPVLAAALNSLSDIIVTGDKDLLDVSDKYGIKIVNPRIFFQIIRRINDSE